MNREIGSLIALTVSSALLCGCAPQLDGPEGASALVHAAPTRPINPEGPAAGDYAQLSDQAYLKGSVWDDGKAEIAFYSVKRQINHYGQQKPQSFLVGTYLVKHEFDRVSESKARATPRSVQSAFKWAAFYEFESENSYQYKRAYVVNASQAELLPFKQSFTSFDWCSNQYRELSFHEDGKLRRLLRSDDYGNADEEFTLQSDVPVIPAALVPLWVRALGFEGGGAHRFAVQKEDGSSVAVTATRIGEKSLSIDDEHYQVEGIQLVHEQAAPSIIASRRSGTDLKETYWRAMDDARTLVKLEAEHYEMTLVETVRSAYWRDDVYQSLERVRQRP